MALLTFEGDTSNNSTTLQVRGPGTGTHYAPIVRSRNVPLEVTLHHSGTVSIYAANIENLDVPIVDLGSTSGGNHTLYLPTDANVIVFDSTVSHTVQVVVNGLTYPRGTSAMTGMQVVIGDTV